MLGPRQMVDHAATEAADDARLAQSRAQFVSSFGRRLEALRQALTALERSPRSPAHRDNLRRRVHALGAAAGVLGFESVFGACREAETVLTRAASAGRVAAGDLRSVGRTIDVMPSLVLGAELPAARSDRPSLEPRDGGYPLCVLVVGSAPLAEGLATELSPSDDRAIECERADDVEVAEQLVRIIAPDIVVVDSDRPKSRELIETLVNDPLLDPVKLVAVGSFDRPESAAGLVSLGVERVLPKPVSPDALRRSVVELSRVHSLPVHSEPIGELTVDALSDRIAREVRRGLVDSANPVGRSLSVPFGEGVDVLAAVWSAVARVRQLATMRSGGRVKFDEGGPEGAIPLAPWMGDDRARLPRRGEEENDEVDLKGRRVLVVDDDPAIVWFVSGLLRAVGAEVLEAHDGLQALDLVRREWPEVVVSDILMPKLDGFALCREIKRDIVLSDVPVILLSWKEDLLQRVRELGAEADGYLRKEASASTVVARVREVLRVRARVETRIAGAAETRGRLDGLTPRSVLQIVCRRKKDARVSFRDAAFLYEIQIRGGRLRSATRTAQEGQFERGERVVAALLGVRAGRFVVTEATAKCREDFDEDLAAAVAPAVERARRLRDVLSSERLDRVARLAIDERALGPYLEATPRSAREIVRRLAGGSRPGDLMESDETPRSLVEAVMGDLILHGAVLAAVDGDGQDLVQPVESARGDSFFPEPAQAEDAPDSAARPRSHLAATETGDQPGAAAASAETAEAQAPAGDASIAMAQAADEERAPADTPSAAADALPEIRPIERPVTRQSTEWGDTMRKSRAAPKPAGQGAAVKSPLEQALQQPVSGGVVREADPAEGQGAEPPGGSAPEPNDAGTEPEGLGLLEVLNASETTPAPVQAEEVSSRSDASEAPAAGRGDGSGIDAADAAFLDLVGSSEGSWPPVGDQGTPVSEGGVPAVPKVMMSKPAPPVSAPPEPSPFEAALRTLPAEREPSGETSDASEANEGFRIVFDESDVSGAKLTGPPDGVEPPEDVAIRDAEAPRDGDATSASGAELSLGEAVLALGADDQNDVPIGDRITVRPEERVTSRPPRSDEDDAPGGGGTEGSEPRPAAVDAMAHSRTDPSPAHEPARIPRPSPAPIIVAAKPRSDDEEEAEHREEDHGGAPVGAGPAEPVPGGDRSPIATERSPRVVAAATEAAGEDEQGDEPAPEPLPASEPSLNAKEATPSPRDRDEALGFAEGEPASDVGRTGGAAGHSELAADAPEAESSGAERPADGPRPETELADERAGDNGASERAAQTKSRGIVGFLGTVAVTAVAFVASFVTVRAWVADGSSTQEGTARQQPGPVTSAGASVSAARAHPPAASVNAPAATASGASPSVAEPRFAAKEMDLPAGISVTDDKGLLEIETGGKDFIYVDGVFVGRGPLRRVPLGEGRHTVRLKLDGREATHQVGVAVGRRTQLIFERTTSE